MKFDAYSPVQVAAAQKSGQRPIVAEFSLVDQQDLSTHALDIVHQVRGQDHRDTVLAIHVAYRLQQPRPVVDVQSYRRLVQKQQSGLKLTFLLY